MYWIKSFSWEYSCVEEYFIKSYKGNFLEYSLLLVVIPRNILDVIIFLIKNSKFLKAYKIKINRKMNEKKMISIAKVILHFYYCRVECIIGNQETNLY